MLIQGGMGAPNGAADVNLPRPGTTGTPPPSPQVGGIPQLGGGYAQPPSMIQGVPMGLQGPGAGPPNPQAPGNPGYGMMPGTQQSNGSYMGQMPGGAMTPQGPQAMHFQGMAPGQMMESGSPTAAQRPQQPTGAAGFPQQGSQPQFGLSPGRFNNIPGRQPMGLGMPNSGMIIQGVPGPGGAADVNLPRRPGVNYPNGQPPMGRPGFRV